MTPSRRSLLGGLAGATLARGCVPVPALAEGPDAELIRLHAKLVRYAAALERLNVESRRLPDCGPEADAQEIAIDKALDDWWNAMGRMQGLCAATPAGLRAKADVMRMLLEQCVCVGAGSTVADLDAESEPEHRFAWSLARDVLALGA